MSTDKISIAILEDFVKKVRFSSKSNQKNITLSISDAENLVHNLNLVIFKLLDKMQNLEEERSKEDNVIVVEMDGGSFGEKR
jgi:hypothetical protein